MNVKIFADGADVAAIDALAADPAIRGFTTNPTLMRQAGVDGLRGVRKDMLEGRRRPPGVVRGVLRRVRRDGAPGSHHRGVGAERVRQDPGHQQEGERSRAGAAVSATAGVKVNVTAMFTVAQVERGDGGARRRAAVATCRCSPGASPTPASTRSRSWRRPSASSARTRTSSSSGPAPARSSTSCRPTPSAATSSP